MEQQEQNTVNETTGKAFVSTGKAVNNEEKYVFYKVTNTKNQKTKIIQPIAFEDGMNPGKIKVISIKKMLDESDIIFEVGFDKFKFPKEKIDSGEIIIEEKEYIPKLPKRRKNGCIPCRNCGACGW